MDKHTLARTPPRGGFFEDCSAPPSFAETAAKKLEKILRTHRRLQTKPKHWEKHVAELLQSLEDGKTRIRAVIDWLPAHIDDQFCPRFYSAKSFAEVFLRLEEQMGRGTRTKEITIGAMTADAARIYELVRDEPWPGAALADLPAVINTSVQNLAPVRSKLKKIGQDVTLEESGWTAVGDVARFARCLLQEMSGDYLEQWFRYVSFVVHAWTDWSGSLEQFVFRSTSRLFYKQVMDLSVQQCGDTRRGEQLMKKLLA